MNVLIALKGTIFLFLFAKLEADVFDVLERSVSNFISVGQ